MEVAGAIEPGLVVEVHRRRPPACRRPIGRASRPATSRSGPSGWGVPSVWTVRIARTYSCTSSDLPLRLQDLKGKRHEGEARHAGQVALRLGVERVPLLEVLLLLGCRPRLIGNLVADDDADAGPHARAGVVILEVIGRGVEHLPEPGEIGHAVRRPLRCLGERRRSRQPEHADRDGGAARATRGQLARPVRAVTRLARARGAEEQIAPVGQRHRAAVGDRLPVLRPEPLDQHLGADREVGLAHAAAQQCRSARRSRPPTTPRCRRPPSRPRRSTRAG